LSLLPFSPKVRSASLSGDGTSVSHCVFLPFYTFEVLYGIFSGPSMLPIVRAKTCTFLRLSGDKRSDVDASVPLFCRCAAASPAGSILLQFHGGLAFHLGRQFLVRLWFRAGSIVSSAELSFPPPECSWACAALFRDVGGFVCEIFSHHLFSL